MGFEADRVYEDMGMDEIAKTVQAEIKGVNAETDIDKLVENFNQWVDERLIDISLAPFNFDSNKVRWDTLNWAKRNLKRIAREIKG